ncbi:hypothetical protein FJY94_04930 [Candidatus Kaiserbacteria bacterium]|nr:hypothetical protein [Candidatus Kaiserbacteria bacterium]
MKSSFPANAVCLVCLAVWGKVLCERPAWAMADAANLVSNAHFESQGAWQSNSDCFSIVKDTGTR